MRKIYEGAEAVVYEDGNEIVKIRVKKNYRHEILDTKLRKKRTRQEFRIIKKLYSRGLPVPKPLSIKEENYELRMQKIKGEELKNVGKGKEKELGEIVAKMHNFDIVHGDLTLRNVLVSNEELVLIDFGLSYQSSRYEDKAMDIFILEETTKLEDFDMQEFLKHYAKHAKNSTEILKRLEKIRERRRYI